MSQKKANEARRTDPAQKQIDKLTQAIFEKDAEIEALKSKLAERDDAVASFTRKIEDQKQLIKESQEQIERMLETHVPRDDIDDLVTENQRLTTELRENEELLAECQKMLEEYVEKS